jgi:tetratricopeptide (TPR) repeat protein
MKINRYKFWALMLMQLFLVFPLQAFAEEDVFEKGLALIKARQYDKAIEAFSEVIEMIPEDFEAYNLRGIARAYKKDYDGAIDDYTMALKIKPGYAEALNNRGFAWVKNGILEKALDDFSGAIKLRPNFLDAYNSKAWLLATSSDPRYRNGKQALELAQKAVEIDPTIDSLDTMSAAYAANGQFNKAIDNQKKVIELMIQQDRADEMEPYIDHLKEYKAHRPLRISYAAEKSSQQAIAVKKPPEPKAQSRPKKPPVERPHKAQTKPQKSSAAPSQKPADNLGPLPYTIQVSAYRDLQKSLAVATRLKKNGDPAFTCPVLIPGKGQWNRVFVGFYQSLDEAKKAAARLKKRKFHYVQIARKPLAVQVGMADSYKEARELKSRLRGKGYMAYSLLDRKGRQKTRILIGAYGSEGEAGQLIQQLRKDGFATKVLPR